MDKRQMNEQAKLAFEFLEKLYFETSYLIKEVEGLLKKEEEQFAIGRTRGYAIAASGSTGLEYPDQWMYKKLSVFFVPKNYIEKLGGKTRTTFKKNLKIICLLVILSDKNVSLPKVIIGTLYDLWGNPKYYKKLEDMISPYHLWDWVKIYTNFSQVDFADSYMKLKGKFIVRDLFDINKVQDIKKKLLIPTLREYRSL